MERRWRLYSRLRLPVGDDLFRLDGRTIVCTGCSTVDDVDFTTAPALNSAAAVTIARCAASGRAEITDAHFNTTRTPAH